MNFSAALPTATPLAGSSPAGHDLRQIRGRQIRFKTCRALAATARATIRQPPSARCCRSNRRPRMRAASAGRGSSSPPANADEARRHHGLASAVPSRQGLGRGDRGHCVGESRSSRADKQQRREWRDEPRLCRLACGCPRPGRRFAAAGAAPPPAGDPSPSDAKASSKPRSKDAAPAPDASSDRASPTTPLPGLAPDSALNAAPPAVSMTSLPISSLPTPSLPATPPQPDAGATKPRWRGAAPPGLGSDATPGSASGASNAASGSPATTPDLPSFTSAMAIAAQPSSPVAAPGSAASAAAIPVLGANDLPNLPIGTAMPPVATTRSPDKVAQPGAAPGRQGASSAPSSPGELVAATGAPMRPIRWGQARRAGREQVARRPTKGSDNQQQAAVPLAAVSVVGQGKPMRRR